MLICNSVAKSESQNSGNPDYYMDDKFPQDIVKFGSNVKIVKPHTGQKFYIRNAEFEVLYTHEDLYPTELTIFNDSSTVMRMTANGQTFMWLGDVQYDASDVICAMYDTYIKSDFVQVSHHGETGGTMGLYYRIDPTVAIWPVKTERYEIIKTNQVNAYLINLLNVQENIVAGNGTRTIQLPYTPQLR
jgi:beta-lactamase superfamily II metal-dependent hydrolase